jgi:hypothetical protein
MGNLKDKRKYVPCCQTKHIERSETSDISEILDVLGDEGFVEEDGSRDNDEEDLEVLVRI